MKQNNVLILILLMALLILPSITWAEPVVIKFSHVVAPNTSQIHVLTEAERAQWLQALTPVNTVFESLVGAENVRELHEIASQTLKERVAKL